MFYSQHILTKKGPLAKIWLAAHMHTKLTKAMAFSTNISSAVARIISPDAPMALRLTSNLLLGVVRIFSRKTKYLLADSSDALARLKLAYAPASSNDLQDSQANPAAITLADTGDVHTVRSDPVGGLPIPDLDFPEMTGSQGLGSQFLADSRDITIGDHMLGVEAAGLDTFERDPALDLQPVDDPERDRLAALGMQEELQEEPLMFTPSQERATPERRRASSVEPAVESIERMRDAAIPEAAGGTPRLSLADVLSDTVGTPVGEPSARPSPGALDASRLEPSPGADIEGLGLSTSPRTPLSGPGATDERRLSAAESVPSPSALLPTEELVIADVPGATEEQREPPATAQEGADAVAVQSRAPEAMDVETAEGRGPGAPGGRPKRRLGAAAALWDDKETELSANFFRECLENTSDIVRPRKRLRISELERRHREEERGLTAQDILSRPTFRGLAPELNELFATCFDAERVFKDPGSPITAEVTALGAEAEEGTAAPSPHPKPSGDDEQATPVVAPETDESRRLSERTDAAGETAAPGAVAAEGLQQVDVPAPDEVPFTPSEPRLSLGGVSVGDTAPPTDEAAIRGDVPPPISPVVMPSLGEAVPASSTQEITPEGPSEVRPSSTFETTLVDVANTRVVVEETDGVAADPGAIGEARMTTRALKMRDLLSERIEPSGSIPFSDVLRKEPGVTRRVAARSFYELLNLCSKNVVTLAQEEPYGNILVTPVQPAFDNAGRRGGEAAAQSPGATLPTS